MSSYERYLAARRRGELSHGRRFDRSLSEREAQSALLIWRVGGRGAYHSAAAIARYDREVRRATAIIRERGTTESLPAPLPLVDGGLAIEGARAGSLDLVMTTYGLVTLVMLNDPLQLLITADWLLGRRAVVRAWVGRKEDSLRGISARNALDVLDEFGRLSTRLGQPDASMRVGPPASVEEEASVLEDPGRAGDALMELPGGLRSQGTHLTLIRLDRDGAIDVVIAEGERPAGRAKHPPVTDDRR
jgi:hypothetical protein